MLRRGLDAPALRFVERAARVDPRVDLHLADLRLLLSDLIDHPIDLGFVLRVLELALQLLARAVELAARLIDLLARLIAQLADPIVLLAAALDVAEVADLDVHV